MKAAGGVSLPKIDSPQGTSTKIGQKQTKLTPLNTNFNEQKDYGEEVIHVEDYDEMVDEKFVNENLVPYLKDLYKDLMMRSSNPNRSGA